MHLERWRMTNPMVMMEHEYSREVALMAVNNWVNNFAAKVPEPPSPRDPLVGLGGLIQRVWIKHLPQQVRLWRRIKLKRKRRLKEPNLRYIQRAQWG